MTEGQLSPQDDPQENKKVSLRDRAIRVGNVIGINGYRLNREVLKRYFAEHGYQVHRTSHFLLCLHAEHPPIVIHWFAPKEMDVDIGFYCTEELKPFGLPTHSQQFSDLFGAIMLSLFPHVFDNLESARFLTKNVASRASHLIHCFQGMRGGVARRDELSEAIRHWHIFRVRMLGSLAHFRLLKTPSRYSAW